MRFHIKLLLTVFLTIPYSYALDSSKAVEVKVWKSPTCKCCNKWIEYMEKNGFTVTTFNSGNSIARQRFGINKKFGSCHTAFVNGYAIEGHVPAGDIKNLLKIKPSALGLAVPGMPVGSPGMDGPEYGGRNDNFDVLLINKDQSFEVFNSY
tara:strand:- start:746 stop:1198 length:453 start_codon:yes stop_codon:yes gene_type:complete